MTPSVRFPIRFDPSYAALSKALFIRPSASYVELVGEEVVVRMAWAFRARFSRAQVRSTATGKRVSLTRGVHGWRGRWLVNGAGDGILTLNLEPAARGYMTGFPVKLRTLEVSVDDPEALAQALAVR